VYCRLVAQENSGGKVFYGGAVALASFATLVLMAVPAVQAYWANLAGLDPIFALALGIPVAFRLCDIAVYVSEKLNAR
jgi:hypothetical protein